MNQSSDVAALRREYTAHGLRRADLHPNPIRQFALWFTAAIESGIDEVNAMTLATVSRENRPSARVVLLKGYSQEGFVFYTNYESEKGQQLERNPHAALVLYWKELERQVRIEGLTKKISREESTRYFHSRPSGSQLGAWVSNQSAVIDSRRILEARLGEIEARFAGREIPLPPNWGGYVVQPDTMEFWQGRPNRLHDRFRYTRSADGWKIERLAP